MKFRPSNLIYTLTRNCDICGEWFTQEEWNLRHTGHEPDCDNQDGVGGFGCSCDLVYHERCCPICNGEPEPA